MLVPVNALSLRIVGCIFAAILASGCASIGHDLKNPGPSWPASPSVIAHRGASALRPEHTLAAYRKAIEDGADSIEPDLVATRDGVLVARHENEISGTTNVADLARFADRKTSKTIDGVAVIGWFTGDFTLAELRQLRARERIPANRPANAAHDGKYAIPTLQEIVDLVDSEGRARNKTIGLVPELKHPSYFKSIGLALEPRLVEVLAANGYRGRDAAVFIQSFEVGNLKELRALAGYRLVQLVSMPSEAPYDALAAGSGLTYADMITPHGLREIARYADVVAPYKTIVIPRDAAGELGSPTRFVHDARAAGLAVHVWTMRPENPFLPPALRAAPADSPSQRGDAAGEIRAYLEAGVDAIFTDDPATGRKAVDAIRQHRR
ncbi:glycerophosphodiester phosphodiesterase [Telluria beijingensis]|uniref:glycerophosphodiester phosphodiesterase n=1 Tax=Telluria beijingensis TaxID=3068633 RepID=UPI0027956E65|nr:glycerophosphodiester phosphodiesterase [Massilia sp. REN29]